MQFIICLKLRIYDFHNTKTVIRQLMMKITLGYLLYTFYQPRTQALHCFYRDQWQLINAKRARMLGQHAKKPSAQWC